MCVFSLQSCNQPFVIFFFSLGHPDLIYLSYLKKKNQHFLLKKRHRDTEYPTTTTWSRFTVLQPLLSPWSLMGLWCPWRNGRRKCQGPIADFIIQTQNLLHHFIGHRESNYSVVQFSTQWLYWGSKSAFTMGKMFFYFICYLKIII